MVDDAPQPIRRGIVRRAFVQDHRGAEHKGAEDKPRAHHPADVRVPEHDIVRPDVETVRHVLRRFNGKTAMRVQRALRLARRP